MIILETERLFLRWFTPEDAPFIYELVNEPGWKQYIGDRGIATIESARDYIESGPLASYKRHGFGLYAMQIKADSTPVGMCGLLKRDTLGDVDIGFALLSRFEGQGLAYEAAAATLAYSRDTLRLPRLVAISTVDNHRSARLLERVGMRFKGMVRLSDDGDALCLHSIEFEPRENPSRVKLE